MLTMEDKETAAAQSTQRKIIRYSAF